MHQGAEEDTAQEWEGSGGGGTGLKSLLAVVEMGGGDCF